MTWLAEIVDSLAARPACGYLPQQSPAAEPTALAAIALHAHQRPAEALAAARHLADVQADDGAVAVRQSLGDPCWTTSLAVIAWQAIDAAQFSKSIRRGCEWILSAKGSVVEPNPEMGHNTQLVGWPWVLGTHSWLEPTALMVAALKSAGLNDHPRTREAVRLLFDRILPAGGCNYGNTTVLGQTLRPHIQPTGVVLLALADEDDVGNRKAKSLAYLRSSINDRTTPTSLAWALHALAAHGIELAERDPWLQGQAQYLDTHDRGPHKRALLALAALGEQSPLIAAARHRGASAAPSGMSRNDQQTMSGNDQQTND